MLTEGYDDFANLTDSISSEGAFSEGVLRDIEQDIRKVLNDLITALNDAFDHDRSDSRDSRHFKWAMFTLSSDCKTTAWNGEFVEDLWPSLSTVCDLSNLTVDKFKRVSLGQLEHLVELMFAKGEVRLLD